MKTRFLLIFFLVFSLVGLEAIAQCDDSGNYWNDSWVSCQTTQSPNPIRGNAHWILYEFDQNEYIDSCYVWNANRTGESGMGANQVIIDYSINGTWIELGTYNFPRAPETDNYAGFLGPNLGGLELNKILITIVSTHDNTACASIAEMQFRIDSDACYGIVDICGVCNGSGEPTWFQDSDGDGLGNINATVNSCTQPVGYVTNDHDPCDNGALGWAEIGTLLTNNGCTGCHNGNAAGGLNLQSYGGIAAGGNICGPNILTGNNLVGIISISGYDACGTPMPVPRMNDRVSGNLDATEIAMIQTWIDGGAPENCQDFDFGAGPSTVSLKAFLEGSYQESTGKMSTDLVAQGLLPANQPYNVAPYNHTGNESISTFSSQMVDWVLVEARTTTNPDSKVMTQAAILMEDGNIKGADGNDLTFNFSYNESYYFVVRHRNHMDVMTATTVGNTFSFQYDFTQQVSKAFGSGQQKIMSDGKVALFAGDMNQDIVVQTSDFDYWKLNSAILNTYSYSDLNLDGVVQTTDYDLWYPNRAKLSPTELGY